MNSLPGKEGILIGSESAPELPLKFIFIMMKGIKAVRYSDSGIPRLCYLITNNWMNDPIIDTINNLKSNDYSTIKLLMI